MTRIPEHEWQWFGSAGHFICGKYCRFHLATQVGEYLVSTVGEYVHPMHSRGSEKIEHEWLKDNWPGQDLGPGRKYETMVFRATGTCECGCGLPKHDGTELRLVGAMTAGQARTNHMECCSDIAEAAR